MRTGIRTYLKGMDSVCPYLIAVSIGLYLIELFLKTENSLKSPVFFLWSERLIAFGFLVEYILRIIEDHQTPDSIDDFCVHGKGNYATSVLGIIDLMSWLPCLIGFFVPIEYLALVRTLRILRLLKYFRYSRHLQLSALAFYRSWPELKSILVMFLMLGIFNAVLIHEIEKTIQPETFGRLEYCAWYVLVSATTVGYGDMYPQSIAGKMAASLTLLIPTLMVYAGMIGVVGANFIKVIQEEIDPNIDPIELFALERRRRNGENENGT